MIEGSSHDDCETYQSQLEWKIQRWLRTIELCQSYPPCQIEEIDTPIETQVSNTTDQCRTEHNNAYSTCQTESDNSTFYAYPDQIDYSDHLTCQLPLRTTTNPNFTLVIKVFNSELQFVQEMADKQTEHGTGKLEPNCSHEQNFYMMRISTCSM